MLKEKQTFSSRLEILRPNAAGIDLGSKSHYVAVSPSKVEAGKSSVSHFSSDLLGLEEMAAWLHSYGVQSIAMETTGIYWLSVYEYLEQAGFEVCLVHAAYVKQVAGRKSDVSDSQWIQQLHSYGLLSSAFVPADKIRELRCYVRHRENLERDKSSCMLKIHKSLDMMNVKIHHCLSDMSGVIGMNILRSIAAEQTDLATLSAFYTKQIKASEVDFQRALAGNYRAEHIFMLQQNLASFDFLAAQMANCEVKIERVLSLLVEGELPPEAPTERKDNTETNDLIRPKEKYFRKNQYRFNLKWYLQTLIGVDLTQVDGLEESTVLTIIGETGIDFTKWKTANHFTSWLKLAPQPKITGGKRVGHFRTKMKNRANQAFRVAALAVRNTKSALGAFYRNMRSRKGPAFAVKATARKIATIFYEMITKKTVYQHITDELYLQQIEEKKISRLMKQAKKLGFSLQKT